MGFGVDDSADRAHPLLDMPLSTAFSSYSGVWLAVCSQVYITQQGCHAFLQRFWRPGYQDLMKVSDGWELITCQQYQ